MFDFLKKFRKSEKTEEPKSLACPDCGGLEFFSGPEGGLSQNICCATKGCHSAFNYSPISKLEEHRIDNYYWFRTDSPNLKSASGERPFDPLAAVDRRAAIQATRSKV